MDKQDKKRNIISQFSILAALLVTVGVVLGGCGEKSQGALVSGNGWQSLLEENEFSVLQKEFFSLEKQPVETKQEPEEEREVPVLEDENVRDNPFFALFLNNELAAHAWESGEDRYLYEYLREMAEASTRFTIHFMAEDLNGDGKNELLVVCQRENSDAGGNLYVFEETEGEIHAWETCRLYSLPEYCGNGYFSSGLSRYTQVVHYISDGALEMVYQYGVYRVNDGRRVSEFWLTVEGEDTAITYCYETLLEEDDAPLSQEPEVLAVKAEIDAISSAVHEKWTRSDLIQCYPGDENAQKIPLKELLKWP